MSSRFPLVLALAPLLAGCQVPPPVAASTPRCSVDAGKPMLLVNLFFGRSIHGRGDLMDREWAEFVDRVVVPMLPDGFTLLDADGAWMNPHTGKTIREHSKLLIVAMPEGPDSLAAIDRIREAYKSAFHQQSVGMTVQPACGSF
jgi:hypothetical protein